MTTQSLKGMRLLAACVALVIAGLGGRAAYAQEEAQSPAGSVLGSFFKALFGEPESADAAVEVAPSVLDSAEPLADGESDVAAAPKADQRIEILDNFNEAIKLSQLQQRPLLVVLGAEWCTWCRKLEQELKSPDADVILKRWIVVTVDVDAEPALAKEFGASALPSLCVLAADRKVVGKREGYMPVAELQEWLDDELGVADPIIQRVLYDTKDLHDEDVKQLVDFLGHRSPSIRLAAQQRLINAPALVGGAVVDTLRSGRLAQQLSALEILRNWHAPVGEIDPWRPDTLGADSMEQLISWVRLQSQGDTVNANPKAAAARDASSIRDLMSRILTAADARRDSLITEALAMGDELLPELRLRLSNSSELADAQRILLRELLFRSLSGAKMRLEHFDVLTALASLNAETHRKAAERVLEAATSQDQPLINELSQDSDPLVRELSVRALQSTGALRDAELLRKLLGDKSPSVRTAVLRELAEKPQEKSIELLIEYIGNETDEDLLVYTTKALAQLGEQASAETAMAALAQNASWRVRAAAIDAIGQRLDKNQPGYNMPPSVSPQIAQAVLTATQDGDAFVAERALALLPKLVSIQTADLLFAFLTEHPEHLSHFEAEATAHVRTRPYDALVGVAMRHLKSDDANEVRGAATIVSHIKPVVLREHLHEMLESPDEATRIAALGAMIASLGVYRDEQMKLALQNWQPEKTQVEPWIPLPESFRTLPEVPNPASIKSRMNSPESPTQDVPRDNPLANETEATSEAARKVAQELNAVDDLFGGAPPSGVAPKNTSTDGTENSAAPKPTDIADSAAPNKPDEALDLLSGLFGSAPTSETVADQDAATEIPIGASRGARSADGAVLPSQWLSRWFATADSDRPEWLVAPRQLIGERLGSNSAELLKEHVSEMSWLAAASLAAGNESLATQVVAAPVRSQPTEAVASTRNLNALPELAILLPWLPPAERLKRLQGIEIDWSLKHPAAITKLLEAATTIDDPAVAQWIFDGATRQPLEPAQRATAQQFLLRALLGTGDRATSPWVQDSDLIGEETSSEFKQTVPGAMAAIQWLRERFNAPAATAAQKAMLLGVASHIEHRVATHTAIGLVEQSDQFDEAVQIAAICALADRGNVSADRAAQWLKHPSSQVRSMALKRLVSSSSDFAQEFRHYGTKLVMRYDDDPPGLWLVRRPLPIEELHELARQEPSSAWQVALVLEAAGEPSLETLASDDKSKDSLMKIVTALVKAQRSDEAALAYYRRAINELDDYGQPAQLYKLLQTIDADEVADLRRQLRTLRPSQIMN